MDVFVTGGELLITGGDLFVEGVKGLGKTVKLSLSQRSAKCRFRGVLQNVASFFCFS